MNMWKRIVTGVTAAFILGVGAISGTQTVSYAAPANNAASIGIVDFVQVKTASADYKQFQATMSAEQDRLQKLFEEKSAKMNDAEKKQLYSQYVQQLNNMGSDLDSKINDKINAVIKDVAAAQGVSVVLDKSVVFYGGKDLTQDVMNKLK